MRYFIKRKKNDRPEAFMTWLEENQKMVHDWVDNPTKTGDNIWSELGKTFGKETDGAAVDPNLVKNELKEALFKEQNGLCCYCGNAITAKKQENSWQLKDCSIEHFMPKNKFKELTFIYENLMLCCKINSGNFYEVKKTPRDKPVNNFKDVARLRDLAEDKIKQRNKNLDEGQLKPGDKIYFPNPPHCDDSKSTFDKKPNHTPIINPTKDKDLVEKFTFDRTGSINFQTDNKEDEKLLSTTISVLSLDCETLVNKRKRVWKEASVILDDFIKTTPDKELKNMLSSLISKKAKPDEEGLLEAFFFVEIFYYKLAFNAINE